jgi:hypothetical protein
VYGCSAGAFGQLIHAGAAVNKVFRVGDLCWEKHVFPVFPFPMSVAFAARVSMSVALSTEKSAEDRDGSVDHAGDRLGELA